MGSIGLIIIASMFIAGFLMNKMFGKDWSERTRDEKTGQYHDTWKDHATGAFSWILVGLIAFGLLSLIVAFW